MDEKLREQACDDDVKAKASAARGTRLSALVSAKAAETSAAWATLRPGAGECAKLEDTRTRSECAAKVEGFVKLAAGAQVTLTAGDEVVTTACGPRTRTFDAETRSVTVGELEAAKDLAARLRAAPAALAVASVAASSPSSSGLDWTSPTLGLMKWIPAGTFKIGSAEGVGESDEHPAHKVTLPHGYWLMEHEVTQGEWASVMGSNPSKFWSCGTSCPVEQVSWDDAHAFIKRVSTRDGVTYRLPTEAEWEYAARGGQSYAFAGGKEAGAVAWMGENSGWTTHAACGKARNGYRLCDMSGNVQEWVSDGYGEYPSGGVTDPGGDSAGSFRVCRGGDWGNTPESLRVADRVWNSPDALSPGLGLRLARVGP